MKGADIRIIILYPWVFPLEWKRLNRLKEHRACVLAYEATPVVKNCSAHNFLEVLRVADFFFVASGIRRRFLFWNWWLKFCSGYITEYNVGQQGTVAYKAHGPLRDTSVAFIQVRRVAPWEWN
jgi:hypothetical protein